MPELSKPKCTILYHVNRSLQSLHRFTGVYTGYIFRYQKNMFLKFNLGIYSLFLFLLHGLSLETKNRGAVTLTGE